MADSNNIIEQAKNLRNNHRGESFNINFAPDNIIRKVANNFTDHKLPNVENITKITTVVQYMIAAKMVGYDKLYAALDEYTGHELEGFCDDIEIYDNCYDSFDTSLDRHLYRANPKIYEMLKIKHIRRLDAGLVKFRKTCHDIFLPDYKAIIDVSTWKAELELKEVLQNEPEEVVNFASTYKMHAISKFEYLDNKLRCTGEGGDPVDLDDADIFDCIVDESFDFCDFNEKDFRLDGLANGNGYIKSYHKIKIDKLHEHDQVLIKDGLVYHDETQKCYMIVGPHTFVHLNRYSDYNYMSIVYKFEDKFGTHVDLIRLNDMSCDTIEWEDWCEDHAEDSIKDGFIYLVKGRTIITKTENTDLKIDFNEITTLLESA